MAVVAALVAGTLGACSSTESSVAAVERARGDVVAATADPLVGRYARSELEGAQDAFAQAERDRRRGADSQVVSRWADVAGQRAAAAREAARAREAAEQARLAEAESRRIESESLATGAPSPAGAADAAAARGGDAIVIFSDGQFRQGRAELDPSADAGIERIVTLLREDPRRIVRLEGHADDMDNRTRSIEVSGRRAEAVRAALVARGIEARRIVVRALGDSYPVASNETPLGRERNRRVEAILSTGAASGAP